MYFKQNLDISRDKFNKFNRRVTVGRFAFDRLTLVVPSYLSGKRFINFYSFYYLKSTFRIDH